MTGGEWYWHVHHAVLVEQLTAPAQDEIETRLRLFKRVKDQGAVFAAQKARDEAVASAEKAYGEAVAPARKARDEAVASAWKAYHEAVAPARKAYDEAVAPARKAYDEAMALARKARDKAVAPARKAYDEAMALARKAYDEAVVVREAHDEAHEKECPDCPWDGRTIFPEKESK